jgi:hypothetical protein
LTMYLIYMTVDAIYMLVAFLLARSDVRRRIARDWWLFFFMPAFRWTVFWFRFAGFLTVLMEPKEWRAEAPWAQAGQGLRRMNASTFSFLTGTASRITGMVSGPSGEAASDPEDGLAFPARISNATGLASA